MKVVLQRVSQASVEVVSDDAGLNDSRDDDEGSADGDLQSTEAAGEINAVANGEPGSHAKGGATSIDASFTPQHIGWGYVALVGVNDDDSAEQVAWMAHKISHLRVFADAGGAMNRSVLDIGGSVLSISQFTLFADARRGNRPSFIRAGKPDHADRIWQELNTALRAEGLTVFEGRFASHMRISLVNDGPVTICLDTDAER